MPVNCSTTHSSHVGDVVAAWLFMLGNVALVVGCVLAGCLVRRVNDARAQRVPRYGLIENAA